ncbi:S24 family peptidase [Pseudomonas sp. CCOS 191]|uniref:S24 family peptidase n=1 Tax=Pseudomonas sp. CCOS 191 TaxID=1649877 RepID=UPI000624DCBC|nr:S24 family peptidase [Pseudomonas sp. CCOS 191]CRI58082.1 Cro/CI family transcriptional regulator [Pseudomonas sp. CCOS 191]
MNISQLRVEALRALIGDLRTKEFADRYNLDASYLSQLLNGHRPLGDKAAKNLEDKIGLPGGTLLMPAHAAQEGTSLEIKPGPSLSTPFRWAHIQGIAQLKQDGSWDELTPMTGWVETPSTDASVYSLRIKGDALAPAIRNGWVVWCEPHHRLVPGEYVVVKLASGESLIKELLYENAEEVSLMSVNDTFGRTTLHRSEISTIHYVGGIVPPSQIKA